MLLTFLFIAMKSLFKKSFLSIVLSVGFLAANAQQVTGYFDASLNQAGTRLPNLQWSKMTDFIYGFIQPDNNGNLPDPTTLSHFNTSRTYCINNGVKMQFSSGGATYSAVFATIGANPTATANFAKEIADILQTYGLTGFDLDWEFPTSGTYQTYQVNILKAIHDEFVSRGKRSEWTIATAVGGETPSVGSQGVYHTDYCSANAFQYLDFLNIMSYDIGYNISGNDNNHSSYADAQNNINDWVTKGCPISKIVLGIPFYARHASSSRWANIYDHAYSDLIASNPSAGYNADNVGSYYYNGKTTCQNKVDLIMGMGGAGVMIWEVTYDYLANTQYSLLGALADAMLPYQCAAAEPTLGADQSICGLSNITLNSGVATASGRTFTWKQGNTTLVNQSAVANTYQITAAGTYTVEVWENSCSKSDEIVISGTLPAISLGGPYDLCDPVSVTLDAGINANGKTITWKKDNVTISGATAATYEAKKAGVYQVTVAAIGCSSVNGSATVTSKVPSADDVVICAAGTADLTASESVNWYATSNSTTILATGTTYSPTVNSNTTYYIAGTGSSSTSYTTMKTAVSGGWQANSQVYGTKFTALVDLTIDQVTVNANGGNVTINLVGSNGTTVVATKTFSVTGTQVLNLGFSAPAGTYYLNAVGSVSQLYVDPTPPGSDYSVPGVISVVRHCYEDWSAPYGDAYQVSSNYGNFANLKVTAGSACARVPVNVTIDVNDPNCFTTSVKENSNKSAVIYPNPSNDSFSISNVENEMLQIAIYDGKGALVQQLSSANSTIAFGSDLQDGIYYVQVQGANAVFYKSIVKASVH
jgi:GH18 family chitinase